ncbi:hypothetical protein BC829DRAFT_378452 [Chytridium lagenaria]|nr:hypothetical protein BC829DRAFT_378452 [Chytridium lagenaria]
MAYSPAHSPSSICPGFYRNLIVLLRRILHKSHTRDYPCKWDTRDHRVCLCCCDVWFLDCSLSCRGCQLLFGYQN